METNPRRIFLSYGTKDGGAFVQRLDHELTEAGYETWWDKQQFIGGMDWQRELGRAVRDAHAVLVVLTEGASQSHFASAEWTVAFNSKIPLIPALFGNCEMPMILAPLQYIDFRTDWDKGRSSLMIALEELHDLRDHHARPRREIEVLRNLRATAANDEKTQIDELIKDRVDRVHTHRTDVRAQKARVEQGVSEIRSLAVQETARTEGDRVRVFGRKPPSQIDVFRDRVEPQQLVRTALHDPKARVVTIYGRGGMGKTALACTVLASLTEQANDGDENSDDLSGIAYLQHTPTLPITLDRIFVNLKQVLPDEDAIKADRVLGRRDLQIDERIDQFLEIVDRYFVVALLDNFEDVLDSQGRITDTDLNMFVCRVLESAGRLRLLVTSQNAIDFPTPMRRERQVPLQDGLPDADAIQLLIELDPNHQLGISDASEATLTAIVRATHGIPRAIELIANILQDQSAALTGPADVIKNFYKMETVVRDLVEVNYGHLPREGRHILEALAVLGRPVHPLAVDFLLQPYVPGLRLDEVLAPLVRTRLVLAERGKEGKPGTLALHGIDREFLYQRIPETGSYSRAALHARAAAFLRTQRTHDPTSWCDVVHFLPQLLEFEHLLLAGDADAAVILLGEYAAAVAHSGHPMRCRDLFLKLPTTFNTEIARVAYGLIAAIWKAYLWEINEALQIGEETLQRAIALQDARLQARVRAELVIAYRYAHDSARSREHAERLADLMAAAPEVMPKLLPAGQQALDLVLAHAYAGNVEQAAAIAKVAYEHAQASGNEVEVATALNGLLVSHFASGRYADALDAEAKIEAVWRPGFHDGIAYAQNIGGLSHYLLGNYDAAVSKFGDARRSADDWSSPRPGALAIWNLSLIHVLHESYELAGKTAGEAEKVMSRLGYAGAASIPRLAAEAGVSKNWQALVEQLLKAAEESARCGDLFPGLWLADHTAQLARSRNVPLVAAAEALRDRLRLRTTSSSPAQ